MSSTFILQPTAVVVVLTRNDYDLLLHELTTDGCTTTYSCTTSNILNSETLAIFSKNQFSKDAHYTSLFNMVVKALTGEKMEK